LKDLIKIKNHFSKKEKWDLVSDFNKFFAKFIDLTPPGANRQTNSFRVWGFRIKFHVTAGMIGNRNLLRLNLQASIIWTSRLIKIDEVRIEPAINIMMLNTQLVCNFLFAFFLGV
jgi:hypothetical protein